ncbi:hypothetical protein H9P43_002040 [Blastocladiella emersonii ATCC 22665]|nr:hypothetical protein H9P43_002040 [Blastocladiella emersonii ATCC 22665]
MSGRNNLYPFGPTALPGELIEAIAVRVALVHDWFALARTSRTMYALLVGDRLNVQRWLARNAWRASLVQPASTDRLGAGWDAAASPVLRFANLEDVVLSASQPRQHPANTAHTVVQLATHAGVRLPYARLLEFCAPDAVTAHSGRVNNRALEYSVHLLGRVLPAVLRHILELAPVVDDAVLDRVAAWLGSEDVSGAAMGRPMETVPADAGEPMHATLLPYFCDTQLSWHAHRYQYETFVVPVFRTAFSGLHAARERRGLARIDDAVPKRARAMVRRRINHTQSYDYDTGEYLTVDELPQWD